MTTTRSPLFSALRGFLESRGMPEADVNLAVQAASRDWLDEQPAAASAPTTAAGAEGASKAALDAIVAKHARERLADG